MDIDPNNKGARLVLSSCSSTLDEVLAAVRQGLQDSGAGGRAAQGVTSGAHNISNPIPHLFCPNALEEQFKQDVSMGLRAPQRRPAVPLHACMHATPV